MSSVWEIDGEDLIVARNEREMRTIFSHYHGESIRGHSKRLVSPDDPIMLTDGEKTWEESARKIALRPTGYYRAYN